VQWLQKEIAKAPNREIPDWLLGNSPGSGTS
jgi:hypothetical protein